MDESFTFLSIDEQVVSQKSVNLEEAARNLQKLQDHIFNSKSSRGLKECLAKCPRTVTDCPDCLNYPKFVEDHQKISAESVTSTEVHNNCDPSYSQIQQGGYEVLKPLESSMTMATGKSVTLPSGRGVCYERRQSVTDEELFGEGKTPHEHDTISDVGNQNTANVEKTGKVYETEAGKDKVVTVIEDNGGIPVFDMLLGQSSGSESESPSSPKPFKVMQSTAEHESDKSEIDFENTAHKYDLVDYSDGQDSNFKMRFRDGRSISAVDKRTKYRISSGGDVFDHTIDATEEEYQIGVHVIRSNSLPDLVTCSSQSPLSPPHYHSNPSPQHDVAENLEKQYVLKKALEGASTMPDSKEKPKIKRTVSIKEEPEYIPNEHNDDFEDEAKKSPNNEEKPVTPTEERRRILSSGYLTGSSEAGSQDKNELGTSRQISRNSQSSSGVWTSQESEDKAETAGGINALDNTAESTEVLDTHCLSTHSSGSAERQIVSPLSSGSGFNDSGSTDSSMNTILDAKTHEAVRNNKIEKPAMESKLQGKQSELRSQGLGPSEIPNLSIMNNQTPGQSSSFGRLQTDGDKKVKKSLENTAKPTEIKPDKTNVAKTPDSYEPPSCGNLPDISILETQESFSLKGSSLAKVQEEDENNHMTVMRKYCGEGGDGSLGAGPGAPGSCGRSGRGLSLSSQASPPEAVKRWEEFMLKLGDVVSPSILEKLYQELRGPDSITSPQSGDKEKSDSPSARNFQDVTLEDLERASRCNFPACKEICCLKIQEVFRVLKEDIPYIDHMYRLVQSYHKALCQHVKNECDETKCQVLFCSEILEWSRGAIKEPVKQFVKQVQKHFRNPTMKLFQQSSFKFHKLQSRVPKLNMKEFETHVPMFTLGKFGTAQVCMDNQCQKLVVLKMYPLMECDHQLSLYDRLKTLDHPHILPQLWLLEYDDKIQVCSLFAQGGSLEDYLNTVGPLPWSRVVRYTKQILSAICYLHVTFGVVYFNWSSGNMLFPDDRRYTIQVGNFSLSCPKKCQWDEGAVKQCLPYHICPPELFDSNYKLDFKSDTWGAGCLFYEMLAGIPVLHHLRHEDQATVHSKIQYALVGSLPDTSSLSPEKRHIFDMCWQRKLDDRGRVQDILKYIESLRVR